MTLYICAIMSGLIILVWSADRFVDGAAAAAGHFGMPPLLIGMIIVGFGTSAPELAVSTLSALQGNPGIALGNAYGSNITNIGLILGLTALLSPILVHSKVLRRELPILAGATALAVWQLWDGEVSRFEAFMSLAAFSLVMFWTIKQGFTEKSDVLGLEIQEELKIHSMPLRRAIFWLALGLTALIGSSRLLVWGAIGVAQSLGISDLLIGLTIVAIGTSLPELASSLLAVRKGEHDIALGNIIGSNLFNTLAVVGLAGAIAPMNVGTEVLYRDILVMVALTASLFAVCFKINGQRKIIRLEGAILLIGYFGYLYVLVKSSI